MFEKLDLKKTIDDETFEKPIGDLKERLSILQRTLRDLNIPVIIVLEGWNAAGITMSIHEIIQSLDPRGFNLHAIPPKILFAFFIKTESLTTSLRIGSLIISLVL